jgi:N-acetyl sugar amidotransferase
MKPLHPKPHAVEYLPFENSARELDTLYGLPRDISYCTECVISNQRPNSTQEFKHNKGSTKTTIVFDKAGICDACKALKAKQATDWGQRKEELKELCDRYRKDDGAYDCLVPGSGGKDSFYQAYMLKYEFGMNPLTITWAPHIYTEWGWKNFQAWIHAGFDNELYTPNGRVHRLLTRLSVENLLHPFQTFILGQKNLAPKVAAKHRISLIFYGENEAEYGNPVADMSAATRSWKYFTSSNESEIFLGGTSLDDLYGKFGLSKRDIDLYMPANPEEIEANKTEVHYLGYYLKWHPQSAYYFAVENGGFQASPERTAGTYSKYNSIDDKIDDFHYYTTFIKFGIGRATYDAAQEVRSGDLTREEAVALIKKYDGEYPDRFEKEVFDYLSINENQFPVASKQFEQPRMDREYFSSLCDRFRSPHIWTREGGSWQLRHKVWDQPIDPSVSASWAGNR